MNKIWCLDFRDRCHNCSSTTRQNQLKHPLLFIQKIDDFEPHFSPPAFCCWQILLLWYCGNNTVSQKKSSSINQSRGHRVAGSLQHFTTGIPPSAVPHTGSQRHTNQKAVPLNFQLDVYNLMMSPFFFLYNIKHGLTICYVDSPALPRQTFPICSEEKAL